LLAEQAERSLQDNQTRLNLRESDLLASSDHVHQLESLVSDLQHTSHADQEEIRRLRSTIAALDNEKDTLQIGVDDRTEKLVNLETDLTAKVND